MILRTTVCMNQERIDAYKQRWETAAANSNWTVVWNSKQEYVFPCLAIFALSIPAENHTKNTVFGEIDFISKDMLLRVLGLSSEELKIEFDAKPTDLMPETFEGREI